MPRYRLDIEYDGVPYCGWQSQQGGCGVQDALERALAKLGETGRLICAGRTDAGVHALGQVAHLDFTHNRPAEIIQRALNAHLEQADERVAVLAVTPVPETFSARMSAKKRHYLYRVLNAPAPSALRKGRVWHLVRPLDIAAMQQGAHSLLGHHDFTTFRAASCQAKSPMRTLETFDIAVMDDEVHFTTSARSFLHHQVRSMVGTLVKIGRGQWPASAARAALEARDRTRCGPVAPAEGLYFTKVDYDS